MSCGLFVLPPVMCNIHITTSHVQYSSCPHGGSIFVKSVGVYAFDPQHIKPIKSSYTQQTQNICITFVQRRPNVFAFGPTLYKWYTNVLCLLSSYIIKHPRYYSVCSCHCQQHEQHHRRGTTGRHRR